MTPVTKKAIRTATPFEGGLSPITDKSRGVPMFGGTPTIQGILDGDKQPNDLKGRGSWSSEEQEQGSFKEKGEEYRSDEALRKLDVQRSIGRERSRRWVAEMEDGSQYEFPNEGVARMMLRLIGKTPRRTFMRAAADVGIVGKAVDGCVGVVSHPPDVEGGIGAAFCISEGMFLTCAHVVRAYEIGTDGDKRQFLDSKVEVSRGDVVAQAKVIGVDLIRDVAILEADLPSNVLKLSSSKLHSVGEDVIVIGSPTGYENTVSTGIISGLDKVVFIYNGAVLHVFTDAKILPGNSGGPIVSAHDGTVVGMVEIIVGEDMTGLNAAIESEYLEMSMKEMGLFTKKQ